MPKHNLCSPSSLS